MKFTQGTAQRLLFLFPLKRIEAYCVSGHPPPLGSNVRELVTHSLQFSHSLALSNWRDSMGEAERRLHPNPITQGGREGESDSSLRWSSQREALIFTPLQRAFICHIVLFLPLVPSLFHSPSLSRPCSICHKSSLDPSSPLLPSLTLSKGHDLSLCLTIERPGENESNAKRYR